MKLRILSLLLLAGTLSGCFWPDPEYEAAAYEPGGAYQYVYYPDYGVYYYASDRVYYWNENGYWRYGATLPPAYPHLNGGVTVVLDSPRPYTQNEYVVKRYGGPRGPRSKSFRDDD